MDTHTWALRWDRFRYWLFGADGAGGVYRRLRYRKQLAQLDAARPAPHYVGGEAERIETDAEARERLRVLPRPIGDDPRVTVMGRSRGRRGRR